MTYERRREGAVELIEMPERIDAREATEIKGVFLDVIREMGQPRIVVDLNRTRFVSSAGIGLFATLVKECKKSGGATAFVNPNRVVIDILRVTKLINFFEIFDTVPEAVQSVEGKHE